MPHVEMSLTEPVPSGQVDEEPLDDFVPVTNLDRWAKAVTTALEPCLLIDAEEVIVATSRSCCTLFGLEEAEATAGRFLLGGGVLQFLDFTDARSVLTASEPDKIPPLLALRSGRLARGIMRIQSGLRPEQVRAADAIATPIWEGDRPAGSLTFFSEI